MGYSEATSFYREEIVKCVSKKDANGAMLNAIAYAKTLRKMGEELKSIKDRAIVNHEADRFDIIAALIKNEGLSDRVLSMISGKDVALFRPAPSAVTPKPKADPKPKSDPKLKSKTAPSPSAPIAPTPLAPKKPMPSISGEPAASVVSAVPPPAAASTAPTAPTAPTPVATTPAPAPVAASGSEWIPEMFQRYHSATVELSGGSSCATGFFISPNGYLLTNHHAVHHNGRFDKEINIVSGDEKIVTEAELIDADKSLDIALLKAKHFSGKTPYIPFIKDYKNVLAGIDMMIIGNGLAFGLAPISGTVKFPMFNDEDLVYTAPTNGGDSGSPVINRNGECIGIHKAREDESNGRQARGIAYATPASRIQKMLSKWETKHDIKL